MNIKNIEQLTQMISKNNNHLLKRANLNEHVWYYTVARIRRYESQYKKSDVCLMQNPMDDIGVIQNPKVPN